MPEISIEEVAIPASLHEPDAVDFIATVNVRNAVEAATYGTTEFCFFPEETLPQWQDDEHEPKRLFAARVGGEIVGRAEVETTPRYEDAVAWLLVHVLPDFRRRGIGTALANRIEDIAAAAGRTKLITYAASPDAPGDRLPSPTGFGSVPLHNEEVRFLLARGYVLEQVARTSRLRLPFVPPASPGSAAGSAGSALLAALAAASAAEFALHSWTDHTPERWQADMARLYTRMSTDAPGAGLEEPEDPWTVDRVQDAEERESRNPRSFLTTAVEHVPTGVLCGFTTLSVPLERERAVLQLDTLVLREHRGHRLGMLLKLANLERLSRERPGHPSVLTFNAEENRHMLDINEALGFAAIGFEGAWRR